MLNVIEIYYNIEKEFYFVKWLLECGVYLNEELKKNKLVLFVVILWYLILGVFIIYEVDIKFIDSKGVSFLGYMF